MDVLMPQLGETVAEGKISTWFKAVGDAIKPGDNLFEIETDKVSMEVPAISAGVLAEIRVPAGATVPVGAIVAVISGGKDATTSPQAAATGAPPKTPPAAPPSPTRAPAPAPAAAAAAVTPSGPARPPIVLAPFHETQTPERNYGPARTTGGTVSTPLARRLAGEAGIDLTRVTGSGPHGRIVARDVEAALAAKPAGASTARGPSAAEVKAQYQDTPFEEIALDNMRRTIAARLVQAKQTIPHFYLTADVEVDRLTALREQANTAGATQASAFKLSFNDFIIKALALALQRVPAANAVWAEDRILRFRHSDIGVAVALEGGLLTPVIRQAETKSLSAISAAMKDLAERARARKLRPDEYQGGATTISNLGMYGIRDFAAIINPPQSTLLAVGAAQRRPVETPDGGIKFVSQMSVTLSCDHRVVDGALGAELLAAFRRYIEQPVTMLV